jgi:hypothetical protein
MLDVCAVLVAQHKLGGYKNMPVMNYYMPKKDFSIYQMGDGHDGTIAQSRHTLKEAIYIVKDDTDSKVVFTGDAAECITVDDPRYAHDQHKKPLMTQQVKSIGEDYSPIAPNVIAWLMGNHEKTIRGDNMTWRICEELKRIDMYGAWTTIINFRDSAGLIRWTGFWYHGPRRKSLTSTAGDAKQQKSNLEAALKKILASLHNAHYMGCGHFHKVILRSPIDQLYLATEEKHLKKQYTIPPESGFIHPDLRWYGCNGGFLKQYCMGEEFPNDSIDTLEPITYAEEAGYAPVEMGMIKLNIRDYKLHSCEPVML